jgi:hypothetical protein
MALNKLEKFDKENPGLVDKVIQQNLCLAILDNLFDDVDDKPDAIELIKSKRLPDAKHFEQNILDKLKRAPNGVQLQQLSNLTYRIQQALTHLNNKKSVCSNSICSLQLYKRVLPVLYAYAQMEPAAKLAYVTRNAQELAEKPTIATRDLTESPYRAYIWLNPDEFETGTHVYDDGYGDGDGGHSGYTLQLKAKSPTDMIKQKLLNFFYHKKHVLEAVCWLIEPNATRRVYLADYFYDNVTKASVELRKALGFPVTDPTFRLFKEYFTEDKAVGYLTNASIAVKTLAALVLEYGTERVSNTLEEYFNELEATNSKEDLGHKT